ncbi:hypothetical protein DUI87_15397 [Hirundo rustica rustica]|uniref:Uncharacterized protein n=1 Tax=Hirundo rustica rustica TaxID=333673 RepID=A0A3M0K413_HIRRU|nr:hypothetical protein DUI87_15397 [Hirundo rustica rustica]
MPPRCNFLGRFEARGHGLGAQRCQGQVSAVNLVRHLNDELGGLSGCATLKMATGYRVPDLPKMVAKRAGKLEDPKVHLVDCLQAILTMVPPGYNFLWCFHVCGHGLWAQTCRGHVQGVNFSQAALIAAYGGLMCARKKDGGWTGSDFTLNKDGDQQGRKSRDATPNMAPVN